LPIESLNFAITNTHNKMKRIAAFIDFTDGCKIALAQAAVLCKQTGAQMFAVHIVGEGVDIEQKKREVQAFTDGVPNMPSNLEAVVGTGDLPDGARHVLRHISPDCVVVGTHGIKGIKQHLFGAHILKLVQAIPYPCIVVQENTVVNPQGFGTILFPVGSHPNYDVKIAQTSSIARIFNSEIVQYEIDKSTGVEEMVQRNSRDAREYFTNQHVNYRYVLEDATVVSVGFSRQTLKFAAQNQIDLIAQMSDVPPTEAFYGLADKENFLTNEAGIPILCCNE
jgi:nucleotide-binding universal stress UspA family protein